MSDRDALDLAAWSALKGVAWSIFSGFGAPAPKGEATPAQMGLLHVLLEAGEPLTPREIATRLDVTPATITGALNGLEEAGFVERLRESADRRVVHVRVTREGRAAASRRRERMRAHLRETFAPLSDREIRQLAATLERLAPPILGPPAGFGQLLRREAAATEKPKRRAKAR